MDTLTRLLDALGRSPIEGDMATRSDDEAELLRRADRLAKKLKKTRIAISGVLFNDGKKLDRLADGGGVYHDVFLAANEKLTAMERDAGITG